MRSKLGWRRVSEINESPWKLRGRRGCVFLIANLWVFNKGLINERYF